MAFLIYPSGQVLRSTQNWTWSRWMCWLMWLTSPKLGLQSTWGFKKADEDDLKQEYTQGKPALEERQVGLFTLFLRLSYSLRLCHWLQLESQCVMCKGITLVPVTPQRLLTSVSSQTPPLTLWASKTKARTGTAESRVLRICYLWLLCSHSDSLLLISQTFLCCCTREMCQKSIICTQYKPGQTYTSSSCLLKAPAL